MELTAFQQRIYNSYHVASSKAADRPFRIRKNFDKMSEQVKAQLIKLSIFFTEHDRINIDEYFSAPFKVYEEPGHIELGFFLTMKAMSCYTQYKRKSRTVEADSEEGIASTLKSIKFLHEFCNARGICLDEYKELMENGLPLALHHLREYEINFYAFHTLDIRKILYTIDEDWLDFYISDFAKHSNITANRLQQSTKTKKLINEAFKIINTKKTQ